MNTNTEGLCNRTAALWAILACASGVYRNPLTTSLRSFVVNEKEELRPAGIGHALGEVTAGKAFDVQSFCEDQGESVHQLPAQFVVKVLAPVRHMLVMFAHQACEFGSAMTTSFASGADALQFGKSFFARTEPTGILYFFAIRQGKEGNQTHVDANGGEWWSQRLYVRQLHLKDSTPVVAPVALDDHHFDGGLFRQWAVLEHAHFPYALDV
jgi:hypothetical protein